MLFTITSPVPNRDEYPGGGNFCLDVRKQIVYDCRVIRTFANAETESFFRTGKARYLPPDIRARAGKRLLQLDAARDVQDLRLPPSNSLEKLTRDRKGQWSIRISKQWRLCFRFEQGDAFEVEIVDYH